MHTSTHIELVTKHNTKIKSDFDGKKADIIGAYENIWSRGYKDETNITEGNLIEMNISNFLCGANYWEEILHYIITS